MRHTLAELGHLALAIAGTAVVAWGAAWAVPHAERTIWHVGYAAMVAVIFTGIHPLRVAWRADHATPRDA